MFNTIIFYIIKVISLLEYVYFDVFAVCTLQSKRQVSKDTFQKWQRTYEKEHQSMTWLRAEMDGQDKSLVSTLWFGIVFSESINMCQVNILWWQVNYIMV